ncbi:MAG: hypothetical protein GY782_11010 [Gammaproteobacteria bacterium]|nr:hypothetical protein [Gammaproteobacteria bacterium]
MAKKVEKPRLGREISVILIIKSLLLFVLWSLCFSHPVVKQIQKAALAQHFFGLHTEKDKTDVSN